MDIVLAFQGQFYRESRLCAPDPKTQEAFVFVDILALDLALAVGHAKVHRPLGQLFLFAPHGIVVTVQEDLAIRCQTLQDFHLGLEDSFHRTQMLNMHGAYIDDHRQIRGSNIGKVGDLPEVVHTHFQDGNFCILRQGQNGLGHTDVVVVVGGAFAYSVSRLQHRGNHFLCGAFAHRTGDANYLHANALPLSLGDQAQGDPGIFHHDGGIVPVTMGTQHGGRAFFQSRGNEIVTISYALKGNKQLVFFDLPGVVIGTQKGYIFIFRVNTATAPLCGLL